MNEDPAAVLEGCWEADADPESDARFCRCCRRSQDEGHALDCPCGALSLALQQRDALAAYLRAEKRYGTLQGAVRLAKGPAKDEMRQRLNESVLELEAALARLRELGIEGLAR